MWRRALWRRALCAMEVAYASVCSARYVVDNAPSLVAPTAIVRMERGGVALRNIASFINLPTGISDVISSKQDEALRLRRLQAAHTHA